MSVSMIMDKREVEGSCGFMDALSCNPQEAFFGGNKQVYINEEKACTCSSSSSIGENSDTISHEESMDDDPQEVESPFSSIQPLHQVLPIRYFFLLNSAYILSYPDFISLDMLVFLCRHELNCLSCLQKGYVKIL